MEAATLRELAPVNWYTRAVISHEQARLAAEVFGRLLPLAMVGGVIGLQLVNLFVFQSLDLSTLTGFIILPGLLRLCESASVQAQADDTIAS